MLLPTANRTQGIFKPAHQVGVVPAASRLILSAVAVHAWGNLQRNECHDYTDRFETNDIVATADAVVGLVGDVPAAYAGIETNVLVVDHHISTKSFALRLIK